MARLINLRVVISASGLLFFAAAIFNPARGQCHTYYFTSWADYTGTNLVISGGVLSLEKTREIGEEWEDVSLSGAPATGIYDLVQFSDGNLYAATEHLSNGQVVWRSTDGVTWTPLTLFIPGIRRAQKASRLAVSVDGQYLYAATHDTTVFWPEPGISGVWRSSDGVSWEVMTGLPDAGGCTSVVETAAGNLVATTKDSGTVWYCPDPTNFPEEWVVAWDTSSATVGGLLPQPNYPGYPPSYLPACDYLSINYHGEHCNGQPYDAYPVPFRPDRTMGLFRASDGWLYFSTNSGDVSRWSSNKSVRGFGHIYTSTDGMHWFDGGSFIPPQTDSPEYSYTVGTWSELTHYDGTPPFDNPPQHQTFPTWIDNFHEDAAGNVYACSTNAEPVRSWILDPRRDGVLYKLNKGASPEGNEWIACGNIYARPKSPFSTDSYTSYNATFCHDMTSDALTGNLWVVTSTLGMVHRSEDEGASFNWWTSPRQVVSGLPASGDFTSLLITCNSCLYAGYTANGEIYASRSRFASDGCLETTAGWPYTAPLSSFTEESGSGNYGEAAYQLSPDGQTYYWWSGVWTAAAGAGESNPAPEVDTHISDFFAPGTFYYRVYFNAQTELGCPKTQELISITVCQSQPPTPTRTPSPPTTSTPVSPWGTPTPSPTPSAKPPISPSPVPASLKLVKTICCICNSAVSLVPPCGPVLVEYQVTNTGLVFLDDIVVRDDAGTPGDFADDFIVGVIPGPVAAGASFNLQTLQTVGSRIYNTAWARSTGAGVPVSDSDTALGYTWMGVADSDYDGDGRADPAVFACADNSWRISLAPVAPPEVFYFGNWGDIVAPGDYDGDGTTDIAVFRDYTGLWAVRGLTRVYFGRYQDLPAPADYDGDGSIDITVCRRQTGLWAVRDLTRVYFGGIFDLPVPGDYDGSGTDRPAIYRPETGLWAVFGSVRTYFGGMEDHPVPSDYDGDGVVEPAIFRDRTGLWAVSGLTRAYFGRRFDWPQPGDYPGDGTAEFAVFRPASSLWAVRNYTRLYWGLPNSLPLTW